jgi:hypothetical protein
VSTLIAISNGVNTEVIGKTGPSVKAAANVFCLSLWGFCFTVLFHCKKFYQFGVNSPIVPLIRLMEHDFFLIFPSINRFVNIRNCCFVKSALQAIFSLEEVCLDIEGKLPDIRLTWPTLFDKFVRLMVKWGAS